MHHSILQRSTLILIVLLIYGCSGHSYVQRATPLKTSLAPFTTAYIDVKGASPRIEALKGFNQSRSHLLQEFALHLRTSQKFEAVYIGAPENNEKNTVFIKIIVEDFKYLSIAASAGFGVVSRNARLKVLAQLIDAETDNIIGELRSGAHTKSSGGIFRGGTGTLIKEISKKLADEIASYK